MNKLSKRQQTDFSCAWLDARLRPVIERAMTGLVPEVGVEFSV